MKKLTTKLLTHKDVAELIVNVGLDNFIKELVSCVEQSFKDYQEGKLQIERRRGYYIPKEALRPRKTVEVMDVADKKACFKIVNFHEDNFKRGLPAVMATMVFVDMETGFPEIIADGTLLTALRTASASAVATKYLAKNNWSSKGIVGVGFQGQAHAHVFSVQFTPQKIYVCDISKRSIKVFKRLEKILGVDIYVKKLGDVIEKSDVLSTCTYGNKPVVSDKFVRKGTHINAVGSDTRGKQEIEYGLLKKSRIIVDFRRQAELEGEIGLLIDKGDRKPEEFPELGQIILKRKPGRTSEEDITIFDSTGTPFEDLAAMKVLARYTGEFGKEIDFIYRPKNRRFAYEELFKISNRLKRKGKLH